MLQVKNIKINNEGAVNAVMSIVNFEKNLMEIELNTEQIQKQNRIINSNNKTAAEKDAAREKITLLEKEIEKLNAENNENEITYAENLTKITGAKNEYTENSVEAVRNYFRLLAAASNRKLFKYVILTPINFETFYSDLTELHAVKGEFFEDNGRRKVVRAQAEAYNRVYNEISSLFYTLFSIPVESEYLDAVKIKINKTTAAYIHEIFTTSININFTKKAERVYYSGISTDGIIKKITRNGETTYNGGKFKEIICKLTFDFICNKKTKAQLAKEEQAKKEALTCETEKEKAEK